LTWQVPFSLDELVIGSSAANSSHAGSLPQDARSAAQISHRFWPLFEGSTERPWRETECIGNLAMRFFNHKRLSCGVLVLNPGRELLLCHVTGQNQWDLPKGGIHSSETPLRAALRETREETGLDLHAAELLDLGRLEYTTKKDLHLFAICMPRFDTAQLHCESHYVDRHTGGRQPEMDGYGWFAFERAGAMCTARMAEVLHTRIDLDDVLKRLTTAQSPVSFDQPQSQQHVPQTSAASAFVASN
jgi:8-oxo-dGTP pyrophosphatase MutT (NUDIX family)